MSRWRATPLLLSSTFLPARSTSCSVRSLAIASSGWSAKAGVPLRDAGELLGTSHQRAAQMADADLRPMRPAGERQSRRSEAAIGSRMAAKLSSFSIIRDNAREGIRP